MVGPLQPARAGAVAVQQHHPVHQLRSKQLHAYVFKTGAIAAKRIQCGEKILFLPRIRIRIRRIRMFLGLLDPNPDPLVRGMDLDPDPCISKQK